MHFKLNIKGRPFSPCSVDDAWRFGKDDNKQSYKKEYISPFDRYAKKGQWRLALYCLEFIMAITLYRGTTLSLANQFVANPIKITPSSNGEFGSGIYWWVEDLNAGIMSAIKYYGTKDKDGWAVVEFTANDHDFSWLSQLPLHDEVVRKFLDFRKAKMPLVVPDEWSNYVVPYYPDPLPGGKVRAPNHNCIPCKMNYDLFYRINSQPSSYHIVNEEPDKMQWERYPVIVGPCAASKKDPNLNQIKFNKTAWTYMCNNGIVANRGIVKIGNILNQNANRLVRNWPFEKREMLANKFFQNENTNLNNV